MHTPGLAGHRLLDRRAFLADLATGVGGIALTSLLGSQGFLAASPAQYACDRCDFVAVCGRDVGRRVGRKPQDRLEDLLSLRSQP